MSRPRKATRNGTGIVWPKPYRTLAGIKYGAFSLVMTSAYSGEGVGASVPMQSLAPSPPMWWGCTSIRRQNALVLSVDKKPSIQALERVQGYLRLPDGKAVNGFSHGYKRHGTTTLFAALEITTGLVKTAHYQRRRRREFLDFMNEIVAAHPDREIHVVLHNLNTHEPKDDRWLKRHPKVHFHFIATYSSWLNQVECWFSILTRQALRGTSFTSPQELRQAIDDFLQVYNEKAALFEWKKAVVFPSAPKSKYSELCD